MKTEKKKEIDENVVYMRIGMAMASIQRVEFVSKKLVEYLIEFDKEFFGFTSKEFEKKSPNIDKLEKYTLGNTLRLLKLNPKLSIDSEFDKYRDLRNSFTHNFWTHYLNTKSEQQKKDAIDFCFKIGIFSQKMESFLKGFTYLLALRFVKDKYHLAPEIKELDNDFNFFMNALDQKTFDIK
ncbi:hypothetical protein UMM65_07905 [Aureibaculum sp. 2210JD6-5]|uniref:hypothetical protein n=1 Tax=Aureibaculum sp. 2210JD6-5 TaxID=3103957 RepID=UPI002AADA5A5|nr:hypothetical protein [Aureibaculum sp. 2210JD6-5]MDY7395163.1 hypothetical protein [Aureibaculum sp. 2210JD6-5]